jgi:ADP-heptose:LPS heptosyltransferase
MAKNYPNHEHIILEGIQPAESISDLMANLARFDQVIAMPAGELEGTISLLKGARLLISNDTGIRNLAITAQTPTLGIFFSTIPFRYWPRDERHDVVFQANGDLPEVDSVFSAAQRLMARLPW